MAKRPVWPTMQGAAELSLCHPGQSVLALTSLGGVSEAQDPGPNLPPSSHTSCLVGLDVQCLPSALVFEHSVPSRECCLGRLSRHMKRSLDGRSGSQGWASLDNPHFASWVWTQCDQPASGSRHPYLPCLLPATSSLPRPHHGGLRPLGAASQTKPFLP